MAFFRLKSVINKRSSLPPRLSSGLLVLFSLSSSSSSSSSSFHHFFSRCRWNYTPTVTCTASHKGETVEPRSKSLIIRCETRLPPPVHYSHVLSPSFVEREHHHLLSSLIIIVMIGQQMKTNSPWMNDFFFFFTRHRPAETSSFVTIIHYIIVIFSSSSVHPHLFFIIRGERVGMKKKQRDKHTTLPAVLSRLVSFLPRIFFLSLLPFCHSASVYIY